MPELAKSGVQFPWNCQWARRPEQTIDMPAEPDNEWVCVRPRRGRLTVECTPPPATDEDCVECPYWEPGSQPQR